MIKGGNLKQNMLNLSIIMINNRPSDRSSI